MFVVHELTWHLMALCRAHDELDFHRIDVDMAVRCISLCHACPAQPECYAYVLTVPAAQRHGVWGGRWFSGAEDTHPRSNAKGTLQPARVIAQQLRALEAPPRCQPITNAHVTFRKRAQTECLNGHAFDEANTYVAANGTRHCRACARESAQRKRRVSTA